MKNCAVAECGAPVVSIPGGEPLIHKEIDQIVAALVARRRFVYLCTNALLLEKKLPGKVKCNALPRAVAAAPAACPVTMQAGWLRV